MANNRVIGVALEGIGSDTSKTGGVCLFYGLRQPLTGTREWWPALVQLPPPMSQASNPYTGDWQTAGCPLALDASTRVAELLLSLARDALGELGAALTAAQTTGVNLGLTGLTGELYLGDETILIVEETGAGVYTITRGLWGSTPLAHPTGMLYFARPPYMEGRLVALIEHDLDTGLEATRWQGTLTSAVMDGAIINLAAEELLSQWLRAEVNVDAVNLMEQGATFKYLARDDVRGAAIAQSKVLPDAASGTSIALQIDDTLLQGVIKNGALALGPPTLLLEAPAPDGEGAVERAYEVFIVDAQANVLSTSQLDTPRHPLAIALALLTSTGRGDNGDYDVLGASWGLGLGFIDVDQWVEQIELDEQLVVDRLVLGWDGEPVQVIEVIEQVLLRPFGFFMAPTDEGKLGVRRLRLLELAEWQALQDTGVDAYVDGPLVFDRRLGQIPTQVSAIVGETPWSPGARITLRPSARSTRRASLAPLRDTEIDMRVLDPSRLGSSNAASPVLFNLLQLSLDAAPLLRIRVADYVMTGQDPYKFGDWIRINDLYVESAWVVDADGLRGEDLSQPDYAGFLIERTWNPEDRTYELGLLFLMHSSGTYVRERAPSAVILEVSGNDITVGSVFGSIPGSASDAAAFTVGDEVSFWGRDGTPWASQTQTPTIASISSNVITLTGLSPDVPYADLIMRLAYSTDYANTTRYPITPRPYAYYADDARQIEEADESISPPDIFGTRITPPEPSGNGGLQGFVGLDSQLVESAFAADSGVCVPVDTLTTHALRANLSRIMTDGHQVSFDASPGQAGDLDVASGVRPYASLYPTSVTYIPWVYQPGLERLNLSLIGRVAEQGAGANPYYLELRTLAEQLGGQVEEFELANSEGEAPEAQPYLLTMDLERPISTREIAPLALWGTSEVSDSAVATDSVNMTPFTFFLDATDSGFYTDSGATRPNDNQLDLQCTLVAPQVGSNGAPGADYDHLFGYSGNNTFMASYPQPQAGGLASRHRLSYLQLRGFEIAQVFEDRLAQSIASLRAQRPVLGEVEAMHALRANLAYERWRPLWIGPQAQGTSGEEGWPGGYVERWLTTNPTLTSLPLIEPLVLPSTDNPTLLAMIYVIPTVGASSPLGQNLADVRKSAPKIPWSITLTCDQSQDGSPDVISESNTYIDVLEHYQVGGNSPFPALSQIAVKTLDYDLNFSNKEGQLFEIDQGLVQLIQVAVPITRTASSETLVKCSLEITSAPGGTPYDWADLPRKERFLDNFFFTVIGASIWEVPNV